jgi:hypothetical protein
VGRERIALPPSLETSILNSVEIIKITIPSPDFKGLIGVKKDKEKGRGKGRRLILPLPPFFPSLIFTGYHSRL